MDLRGFLLNLEKSNQLKVLHEELNWNLQVGAIATMNNRMSGPVLHFKKIKDYSPELSLVSGLYSGPSNLEEGREKPWSRQAMAELLEPDTGYEEFIEEMAARTTQTIPALLVASGPCKEEIISGHEIDISHFPFPHIHQGDGGRYGNCSIIVTRDPVARWQYCGWHKWMIAGRDRIAINFRSPIAPWLPAESTQPGTIWRKYKEQKKAMPCAIVVGGSPVNLMASAMFNPPGSDIIGIAGGLQREPISLVKTESADLYVPSDAEIIIEGEISVHEMVTEGPYPDIIRRTPETPTPAFNIREITSRKGAIIPFMADGDRGSEAVNLISSLVSLHLTQLCKAQGIALRWVNCPPEALMSLCVISIERIFPGQPSAAARTLYLSPLGKWFDKVLVLDPDVEPVDLPHILNCLNEKADPERYHFMKGSPGYLIPYSNSDEKNNPVATKLYIDATYPLWWEPSWLAERLSIEACFPDELKNRAMARWKELRLPGVPYLKKVRTLRPRK